MPFQLHPYLGSPSERMVLVFDIGNTNSSVSLIHLQFGKIPAIRTVNRYPGSHNSSRFPSAIQYDLKEMPRAFGGEALRLETQRSGRAENWTLVTNFKSQMLPPDVPNTNGGSSKASSKMKLARRSRPASLSSGNLSIPSSPSTLSLASTTNGSVPFSARAVTPEHLSEAWSPKEGDDAPDWVRGEGIASSNGEKKGSNAYHGPMLKLIYADHLKHLIACARAWYRESVLDGEETFMRLWEACTFVIAHPADWGPKETDMLREAMQLAKVLPHFFVPGRLVFVKEPASTVYFARRHAVDTVSQWLQPGKSFALCDSAEVGTSIIGYTVTSTDPLLKLRANAPVSRLPVGAHSVTQAFQKVITKRLAKSKFRTPEHITAIMEQFEARIKKKFSRSDEKFLLKFAPEGSDLGAGIRDGWLAMSGDEIEEAFKPSIDAIVVRLSSVLPRGSAEHILVAGGFGESPYLQRRLREAFEPKGVPLVIPDIPTHNAVCEGAAYFYIAETVLPRPLPYSLGTQTALDWSSKWQRGFEERKIFTSVTGRRYLTGAWSEMLPAGTILQPEKPFRKSYNVKYVLAKGKPTFSLDLWGWRAVPSYPCGSQEGRKRADEVVWMTEIDGTPKPEFVKIGTVEADLENLVQCQHRQGDGDRTWVQLDLELLIHLGESSLEACIVWTENTKERRGPQLVIDSIWL